MRTAWVTGAEALRQRLIKPYQVETSEPEAFMPPDMV
jgi:hypothetical protein